MIKISVVVAIYKVENYLRQCLDSIVNQTYQNIEIILVDDGSPDKCPEICDEFQKLDSRVKVIHQINQGSIQARWNGMLEATGDYLSFVDGDDWLHLDMYEHMISLMKGDIPDLITIGYDEVHEDGIIIHRSNEIKSGSYDKKTIDEIYDKAIYTGIYYESGIIPALWNKLFKKQLFIERIKQPDKEIRMGDDAAITYPFIAASSNAVIDNEYCGYYYRFINSSMSHSIDHRFLERAIKLIKFLDKELERNIKMHDQVFYYMLFITELGLYQLFSKKIGLNNSRRRLIFDDYREQILKLDLKGVISKDTIKAQSYEVLSNFLEGDFYKELLTMFRIKLCNIAGLIIKR